MSAPVVSPARVTVLQPFLSSLPPIIARKAVHVFTGGLVCRKTLANDDARGCGPRKRLEFDGLGVAYPRDYLLEYLERRGVSEVVISDEVLDLAA